MFIFYSNRKGCLPSLVITLMGTIILLAILILFNLLLNSFFAK